MAIILNIDTAIETASICVAKDGEQLHFAINSNQKDHAAWLHPAIRQMLADLSLKITDLDAVAVTIGPGSYTGLRVGLSATKGFCYALNIPLIAVNTLKLMAGIAGKEVDLVCPVIDARRMEVFMALYTNEMRDLMEPCAKIIDSKTFDHWLQDHRITFIGNAVNKLRGVIVHPNAVFKGNISTAADMVHLSQQQFNANDFADTAYVEPFYIKEFYSNIQQQ
jgi:tRNA threonylcarbamoyladenosine biosynthesis protein TsaB